MENQNTFKTPGKTLAKMQVVHLGNILFKLQFVGVAIMIASVLTFIMPAIYYILLICAAFLSLFTLFANPTFKSLWSGGDTLTKIATFFAQSWKFTVPILAFLAVASIVCLCFDKNKKPFAKIAVSVVVCICAFVVLFLKIVNAGGV